MFGIFNSIAYGLGTYLTYQMYNNTPPELQWSCEEEKVSKCQFQARSVKTIIVPAKPYKQDDTLYEIVRWSDECAETNHH